MLRYLITLLVFCSFCSVSIHAQIVKSISVGFTRTIIKNEHKEVVKGNIYYQNLSSERVVLRVTEPISQWMVLEGKTMLIYYPNEQKAFQFSSENPFSLPFFQTFNGIGKDDLGLSEAGFKLVRHEVKENILLTYWQPPKQAKKVLGNTIIGMRKDRLVFVEVQNARGKRLVKTTYHNHFQYGDRFFPLEVVSTHYQKNSSIVEKIVYANPQFNVVLPQEVLNFKVPLDIEVKGIE